MSKYGYIKHNEMSGYAIAHHGILGQKWGIRRYQNPDGSLTEAGRKRYGYKTGSIKTNFGRESTYDDTKLNKRGLRTKKIDQDAFNAYNKRQQEENKKQLAKENAEKAAGKKLLKTVDMIGDGAWNKDPERSRKAAIVGLKALDGPNAELDKGNIDWFLWEDQTIGMPTVADLAIKGYTKEQIQSLIEAARDVDYDEIYSGNAKTGLFDLQEGYWHLTDKFIDNCIKYSSEIKNDEKSKQNTVKESPYKVKGASQSIKGFSVSKAASDCAKMIDKFNAELNQPNEKVYSGEDIQGFLEKNLKEFNDLWNNDEDTVFDLEEKIAKELDKKGYTFID